MTPAERDACIRQIESFPRRLRDAVAGASDRELDTTYRDGGWTVRQVVHHLADSHMNACIRARLTLTEDGPTLRPYSQDDWAQLPDAHSGPLEPSLLILEGVHARWAALFRNARETDWARPAHHPEYGATSLEGILQSYSAHGDAHLGHIRQGRERFAAAPISE